jgi:hypothetical protein
MVSVPPTIVVCSVCGSPEWVAARPGTAADAPSYQGDLVRCEEIPTMAWCLAHWPWRVAKPKYGDNRD